MLLLFILVQISYYWYCMARIKGKHAWALCLNLLDKDDMINMNFNVNPMTLLYVRIVVLD
jgi:hypothetical protein